MILSERKKMIIFIIWVLVVCLGTFSWSKVFANEHEVGQRVEVGLLGQVSLKHLDPAAGVYCLIPFHSFEIYASAWTNPFAPSGGLGVGTLHNINESRFWLGWEAAVDLEHDGALVYGLGPVVEIELMQHRLHTFLKVPVEYGHEFGWATIAGLSVGIWH